MRPQQTTRQKAPALKRPSVAAGMASSTICSGYRWSWILPQLRGMTMKKLWYCQRVAHPKKRDTYHPQPKVPEERNPELKHGPTIILGEDEGIGVHVLSLHPAAPVPDCLPGRGHGAQLHEVPKEARQN